MRRRFLKSCFSLGIVIVCLMGLLSSLSWYLSGNNKNHTAPVRQEVPQQVADLCSGCREIIDKVNRLYAQTWEKKEDKYKKFSKNHTATGRQEVPQQAAERYFGCREITDKVNRSYAQTLEKKEDKSKIFSKNQTAPGRQEVPQQAAELCSGCREIIDKVNRLYAQTWEKKEGKSKKFRSELRSKCQGFEKAIITQANTVVGSKIVYDGERKSSVQVTPEMFNTFPKEHPFPNKTYKTCAVVGNGGILSDSGCGKMIDSAQFVIRCNLPPLNNGYQDHVGVKTDLVTANPSILVAKYGALMEKRCPFIESLRSYGNSLLLLPTFSYRRNTPVSLRAFYSIEDFGSPTRTISFNPQYLQKLDVFWRSKGLRAVRLSTGLMVASLALELCSNVHLFGFWPFGNHPHGLRTLKNHYYDDIPPKKKFHAMPVEFELLLQLHTEGVLRLHLDDCVPGDVNLMGSTRGDGRP
ncbi:alpha-2,8-sialyltransferase 8E-like isoform X4 [Takifugu flavidus]|uniref:alpha-2,8-sialyltransferase 8E-like isoform X4 n=1 Tax=Takifugu flavidus TaxID=433684 RepID=UPI002543FD59|nr:alpha-2,8-sialyltransferase 8E-like isoform X4 [Takifugu flavidus]